MYNIVVLRNKYPDGTLNYGKPTYFLEKILKGLVNPVIPDGLKYNPRLKNIPAKRHVVVKNRRFRVGQPISIRVWDKGNKKQIIVLDATVQSVYNLSIQKDGYLLDRNPLPVEKLELIAKNDGYPDLDSFESNYPIGDYQIVSWSELIY